MTRRIVLAVTAFAVIGTGAGAASATASNGAPQLTTSAPPNQLCLLLYRYNNPQPQHICVNW